MNNVKKILIYAREAGGVAAIAPVCEALFKKEIEPLVLSKDHGIDFFCRHNLNCIELPVFDSNVLNQLVHNTFKSLPDIIFTSAASLPTLDMTERYLWRWGQEKGIHTVGLVDQWQNFGLRFSGVSDNERLAYLPESIFVMDELAKNEMVEEGIPKERIFVTGQPAFDKIIEDNTVLLQKSDSIKDDANISENFKIVMFVAESLKKDFGDRLGYDEQSTIEFLGNHLHDICNSSDDEKIILIVKLHPENKKEEFDWILTKWPSFEKRIIENEFSSYEMIAISDIIVGMTSIMLIEAILIDKISVSLQLNSRIDSQLIATKVGAIPFIKNRNEGRQILSLLLNNKAYRQEYLHSQKKWTIVRNATENCINLLSSINE